MIIAAGVTSPTQWHTVGAALKFESRAWSGVRRPPGPAASVPGAGGVR